MRTLVTGATGYIGGRLVPELLRAGHQVRVLARHPERLGDRTWVDDVEIVAGDATDPDAVRKALTGIDVAYYLMHSLMQGDTFEQTEHEIARLFGETARSEKVGRIVYLGGLQPADPPADLSHHMRSRGEVGRILRSSGVPTAELRAAVIIGSGSASFEIIRYLTERLPAMITPRWLRTRTQPIAIRDVLYYLVSCATLPPEINRTFDIGGPDVTTYEGMIEGYAAVAGLRKRIIVRAPVLTPRLSSRWVGLVTPVPSIMARPLVESLTAESVCGEHDIAQYVPDPEDGLIPYRTAVDLALQRIQHAEVRTTWSSSSTPGAPSDPHACRPRLGRRTALHRRARRRSSTPPPPTSGPSSKASAASAATTRSRSRGRSAGGSTAHPAASGSPADAATPTPCAPATSSTSGASRSAGPSSCCACAASSACLASRGSSSASAPRTTRAAGPSRSTPRRRTSTRAASPARRTGPR